MSWIKFHSWNRAILGPLLLEKALESSSSLVLVFEDLPNINCKPRHRGPAEYHMEEAFRALSYTELRLTSFRMAK